MSRRDADARAGDARRERARRDVARPAAVVARGLRRPLGRRRRRDARRGPGAPRPWPSLALLVVAIGAAYAVLGPPRRWVSATCAGPVAYHGRSRGALMVVLWRSTARAPAWILDFGLFPQTVGDAAAATRPPCGGRGRRRRSASSRVLAGPAHRRRRSSASRSAPSSCSWLSLDARACSSTGSSARPTPGRRTIDELHRTQDELAAAERAQGVPSERERISREIHDTLAQGFTSVVTLARATELALDRGDLAAVARAARASSSRPPPTTSPRPG